MKAPHQDPLEAAIAAARESTCQKSRRGAAIFSRGSRGITLHTTGHNGLPRGRPCSSVDCGFEAHSGGSCRHRAAHAEERAVVALSNAVYDFGLDCDLVHIKLNKNGHATPGGGPSCAPCAKMMLDCGVIGHVWLWLEGSLLWKRYPIEEFYKISIQQARRVFHQCVKCDEYVDISGLDPRLHPTIRLKLSSLPSGDHIMTGIQDIVCKPGQGCQASKGVPK